MPEGEETPNTVSDTGTNVAQGEQEPKWFTERLSRFEKKLERERIAPLQQQLDSVRQRAQENGFDLALLGLASESTEPPAPKAEATPKDQGPTQEAIKLMRLQAAYDAGLPQEALPLITATTQEDIVAQVEAVKLLNPRGNRLRSPVPPTGANGNPLPTFKRSQLRDGKFYQEHRDEIRKAIAEGRIENDVF